jgi:hypoxanthine phosphoribosyltransferase
MSNVIISGHSFKIKITSAEIQKAVSTIAKRINTDLNNKNPLFLCVLNGSFMFVADLMKKVNIDCNISFIKLTSYEGGMISSGTIKELIGINEKVEGRTVVIVEDIVDTGETIEFISNQLKVLGAAEIKVVSLLFKPEAYTKSITIDYTAIVAPNDFLVGYGLDYKGHGRNLSDIYVLDYIEDEKLKRKLNS